MADPGEISILKKIGDNGVMSKEELLRSLGPEAPERLSIDTILKSLLQSDYITTVSPVGTKCFAVTKNGHRALSGWGV